MATPTVYLKSTNHSIKMWGLNDGDVNNPKYIFDARMVTAEKINDKSAAGAVANVRVAIRKGGAHTHDEFFMPFIDPTKVEVNGVTCTNAADFLTWFHTAQSL